MNMWHDKKRFNSSAHRKNELIRFVNYYNRVKPHKGIDGLTPVEKLISYFYPGKLQITLAVLTDNIYNILFVFNYLLACCCTELLLFIMLWNLRVSVWQSDGHSIKFKFEL